MKVSQVENQLSDKVRECARQIWLAGLGAFARAREEGGKLFDTLVQEGEVVDAQIKKAASGRAEQAKNRIKKDMRNKIEEVQDKATASWNKLEEVFQARVARALQRLGAPTRDDVQLLFQQVELLGQNIQALAEAGKNDAKAKKAGLTRTVKTKTSVSASVAKTIDPTL